MLVFLDSWDLFGFSLLSELVSVFFASFGFIVALVILALVSV